MFRAEFMGEQWGVVPELLSYHSFRTCLAYALIHDVSVKDNSLEELPLRSKIWDAFDKVDINRTEFHPYWNNSSFVQPSHPEIKVSFYKGEKGVLLIASNLTDKDIRTELELDLPAMGLSPSNVIILPLQLPSSSRPWFGEPDNLFDEEKTPLINSKLHVSIQAKNFRMVLLQNPY